MAVINQLFRQSHFILYFLIILCLLPIQILVQSEQVKISSKSSNRRSKPHNKKVIRSKRNMPVRNVNFDRNSYYALLYVGGIVILMVCLMLFPNIYRKPIHYFKNLLKNSKIHSFGVGLKNIGDITFEYVKRYVEIGLNIINYKLIYKMIMHLIQYLKSILIFYGDKNSIYNWLVNRKDTLSEEEWGIEPNDSYGSSSPIMEYSRPRNVISKSNSFSKNKKGNNKKGNNNKNQHGTRQKSEAILPVANNQSNVPYKIATEQHSNSSHFASSVSTLSQMSNNQKNINVNNMAVPSNSNQTTNIIPIKSEDTMVNIMDKSIQNVELVPTDSVTNSKNTYDAYSTELTPTISRESNIEYSGVMNYDSYSTISNSLTDLTKMSQVSPSYENTTNNRSNDQYFMAMPSSNKNNNDSNIDHVDPSWTMETNSNHDGEKEQKIKGILVNKPTHLSEIKNDDDAFEIVNKKKGKRGHKHSLSFSIPLATTIESADTKSRSHNRSSSSTTLSLEKEESTHPQAVLLDDTIPKNKKAYSNTVHSNRKQLRKRSISTPMPLDKEELLKEKETGSMNNNISHGRRYSTSIIDTTIRSYADALNSNLNMNLNEEVVVIKNNNNQSESNNKKNKKISKNTSMRNNSDQGNNYEDTKSNQNSGEDGKGSNEKVNGNDQREDNVAGASKKKAAKVKKETKGKNKVAADTTDQGKVNGELKAAQTTQKKKAAKATANAKKKEAKNVEESGLLVTGEITYGKAGLQDEPIPTDEEAYEAIFSENATYWTPLERTDRIRNSPYYDHDHHIAKYGKIKYKPMIEYDTDMNEINSDLEGDEATEKVKKEDKKKKKKKANTNANASVDDVEGKKEVSEKKGKKKKAISNKEDEDSSLINEDQSSTEEKISKSKKKGKSTVMDSAFDSSLESGNEKKSEEGKKASKKKKQKAVKTKAEAIESSSEVEIPMVPAKATKVKKTKKTAKKVEVSESEDEPEMISSTLSSGTSPNTTEMNSMIYSSSPPTNIVGKGALPPLAQNTFKQQSNEDLLNNLLNSNNSSNSRSSLMFNKVSQPSPLSSVSYLNYYDDQIINNTNNMNMNMNVNMSTTTATNTTTNTKPLGNSLNTSFTQSPILPVQTSTIPLFGPTLPKMDSSAIYSFTNGPSLTISTVPASNLNENNNPPTQEETIIDLFNRTNKSFRRPRSISLNSHFQPSNEFRSNLSPLLMSTLKNSTALKLDQNSLLPTEQYNNIKLSTAGINNNSNNNGSGSNNNNSSNSSLPFQNSLSDNGSNLFNSNNLSTNYIPSIPIHGMSMESTKETIPAQSPIKNNGFNDLKMDNDGSLTSPIIKKPTENVIQRYRRARTLSSPAAPPSVDNKKNHFYSPFMTGLDIKYDFYIPKSNNAVSPLSSSFTAGESRAFELKREETTRRRSRSINERNRPSINDF
ncbi:hypothetical protein H8356DRAFT_918116 [Neocallimastix lanati (nom. inval.)]|nr:hypothetical protein H8356DRAFT_918116 [Neocallimastix sp. JGI-2020a]